MRTGWPDGLMQDDSRELSLWLASRVDARRLAREAAHEIAACPQCHGARRVGICGWTCPLCNGTGADESVRVTAQSETPPGKGGVSINAVTQEKTRDE
jgi:ribosomal protein L37AE/L43A